VIVMESVPQFLEKESPVRVVPVPVKYLAKIPHTIRDEDRTAIDDIIGRIPALGNPVVVEEASIWPDKSGFPAGVRYDIGLYQVYLVRTRSGKWWLSQVYVSR
jgi:hypothetical protein